MKKTIQILLIIITAGILTGFILYFQSCGETSKLQEGCIAMENQSALVVDFYNASGNEEYDYLSAEISDAIYRKLNVHFLMNDPVDVRHYMKSKDISGEALYDYHTAIAAGEHF
jgi:hypothetical protein